ncbi:MAG: STAS domain-containing protein, partial [Solirubrobacterales bacterium]|nr:STAS domain-containing protein [Solirubrobacterales bacterium]
MSDISHIPTPRKVSPLAVDQVLVGEQTAVVSLAGDLDLWSAPRLKSALCDLLDDGRTQLVVDLERVGFMDSTALGVMIGIQHRFGEDERMVIAAAAPPVLRVLELSGLATGLRLFATRDDALDHVSQEPPRAPQRATPPLTADAALMLGIASTAMPFARSAEDQA